MGLGRNKKSAQHDAAAKCLKETKNIFVPLPEGAGLQTVGGTPGRDQTNIFQYIDIFMVDILDARWTSK